METAPSAVIACRFAMSLTPGQRTREITRSTLDPWLAARRVVAGTAIVSVGACIAVAVHGLAAACGLLLAIPGFYTLAAATRPWVAPCPACGHLLGTHALALPDEPVVGPRATDIRCPACGVYVDALDHEVREVPFNRQMAATGYSLAMDANAHAGASWGQNCLLCGQVATWGVPMEPNGTGLLTAVPTVARTPLARDALPFCETHARGGHPTEGVVVVARARDRVTVQFTLYGAYRAFLDRNRDVVDVAVRW